ncbi:hypothetical protein PINS_up009915 [Pythium insidiosum]|nr:hypothetical protein PINS_up009915 [Pythium insidiosum]
MDLQDFVPKDEVRRLREKAREEQEEMQQALSELRAQLSALEREKQQLEQDLTDVHNYQESERGQRFQEMEEELARTKLEAVQKAHDLRKMELVIEALRKRKKSKSSRSNAASDPPSPTSATSNGNAFA